MKNNSEPEFEILKAVAQAWHAHSGSSRTANEHDAYRRNFQRKPSRFKLDAMNKSSSSVRGFGGGRNWDFKQSLWDAYEIVSVSKKLERGVGLDNPFDVVLGDEKRVHRKKKESKNSLRNMFNRISSRRFNEADISRVVQDG